MSLRFARPVPWRKVFQIFVPVTLTIVVLLTAAIGIIGWSRISSSSDRLVFVADTVTGGGMLLTIGALVVAWVAYLSATGAPSLEAEIEFEFSFVNEPVFQLNDAVEGWGYRRLEPYKQVDAQIRLWNRSSYSARNPAVRIDLVGLGGLEEQQGWTRVAGANSVGTTGVQWDDGADFAIHGGWARVLPPLTFRGVFVPRWVWNPLLVVSIVADGFQRIQRVPVRVLEAEAYSLHSKERLERLNVVPDHCYRSGCKVGPTHIVAIEIPGRAPITVRACAGHARPQRCAIHFRWNDSDIEVAPDAVHVLGQLRDLLNMQGV